VRRHQWCAERGAWGKKLEEKEEEMSAELSREEREGEERKVRKFGGEEWREWNGKRGLDLILPEATKHSPRFARVAAWKLRHHTHTKLADCSGVLRQ
jgi:hypothetical protein